MLAEEDRHVSNNNKSQNVSEFNQNEPLPVEIQNNKEPFEKDLEAQALSNKKIEAEEPNLKNLEAQEFEPKAQAQNEHTHHGQSRALTCLPRPIQKYAGMIFTLLASILFSTAVLLVKILNMPPYGFHAYSSSFWRYMGVGLPAIPLLLIIEYSHIKEKKESVFSTVWPLRGFKTDSDKWFTILGLMLRGFLGASSVILRYFALEYLSIADTSVITYATPVLVTVLAHFCLGEKMGVVPVIAAVVTFCGVLAITRPPFLTGKESYDTQNLIGIALACGSLLCAALIVIITRKIRKVHFSLMTLVFGFIGIFQALILTQIFDVFRFPTQWNEILLILALMILSFVGQMAIILALTFEQAGPVSLIRSCDVIFGFLFQFIFLGVVPDELSAIGGITVVTCITVIGARKWLSTLPETNEKRKRYRCFLF